MVVYILTRIFVELFRYVPFWLVYVFSDILRFILFDLYGYRKKIIFKNLHISFPEKNKKEINKIAKAFYKNFADILVESIKGFTMSKAEILKRYKVINAPVLDKYYDEGKSVISVAAHYTNWEWLIGVGLETKHKANTIYKPLSNNHLNNYLQRKRERFGMKLIPLKQTGSAFNKTTEPVSVLLIADQSPKTFSNAFWLDFFELDTPCIHGPEAYSRKMNLPVVFFKFNRAQRGFYTLEIIDLTNNPNDLESGALTKKYMNLLENIIKENPGNWLWSHKRWKYKRENGEIVM